MASKINGYTVVCYPESMPDDWEKELRALPFGYALSLHDKDTDDVGQLKKAHMHIFFQGKPTKHQKEYIHRALGITYGEDVRSAQGMFDYLTHENNPEKYHYSRDNIQYSPKWSQELFEVACTDSKDYTQELIEYILENGIYEYSELMISLIHDEKRELLKQARQPYIWRFIDSLRHRTKQ